MAHECPDCGQTCYCGRDIDDCCFNFEEDVIHCTHCLGKEDEDDYEDYYEDNPELVESNKGEKD